MDGLMTKGSITKALVRFSIPLIISGLLQQLYSWADALIVGNYVGEASLAAIGATGTISFFFIAIIQGFSVGISVLVAQAYGAHDTGRVTRTTTTFMVFLAGASLLLLALAVLLNRPLLTLLGTPADIYDQSAQYLSIIFIGLPIMALYNLYNAVLRGIGDSRTPLLAIVVSSVVNVLLDLLFVAVFSWGVAGAAAATVLSQLLMVIFLALYAPRRHEVMRFRLGRGAVDKVILREGIALSLPTALQSSIHSAGGLLLQNVMNSFGTQVVAGITTAYRIDSLGMLPTSNIGTGVSTFTGQNRGAGDVARTHKGLRVGVVIALVTSLVTTIGFVLGGASLMRLFGVSEPVVAIGRDFLYFCAAFYPVFALQSVFASYLQGMGDVRFVAFASVSSLVLRIALSFIFATRAGHQIIAYSEMFSWVYTALLCIVRYWVCFGRHRAQMR